MATARPESRRDSRATILAAALELYAERGSDAATMDEIRRRAGVSNGSLFHHFPDRASLAAALYLDALDQYQVAIRAALARAGGAAADGGPAGHRTQRAAVAAGGDAEAGVRALVGGHLRWVEAHPAAARWLADMRGAASSAAAEVAERNRSIFAELRGWRDGHVAAGALRALSLEVLVAVVIGPAQEVTHQWLRDPQPGRLRRLATPLADAAWRAVRAGDEEP